MRNAIKTQNLPPAPHEVIPKAGKNLPQGSASSEYEWDSDRAAQDFRQALKEKNAPPRDRFPYATSSQQNFGWSLSKTSPLSRSSSTPAHLIEASNSTNYEWLRPALQERLETRSRRWDKKLADAEAGLAKAMG